MTTAMHEPIAVVGVSAIMPDGPDAATFWANIKAGRYCISDVPPERWDPELFYDPDPHTPEDKTYSRIGGWVREFAWEPFAWKLPIPPTVSAQMDDGQRWAVAGARSALLDAGWPDWTVDHRASRRHHRRGNRRRQAASQQPADSISPVHPRAGRRTVVCGAAGAGA